MLTFFFISVSGHAFPRQGLLDKLDDATTELMTGDGDPVMLMLGDSFLHCEEDYATEYCERKQEVGVCTIPRGKSRCWLSLKDI